MKRFKRCFSLMLAICLCLTLVPVTAMAAMAGDGTYTWPVSADYPVTSG